MNNAKTLPSIIAVGLTAAALPAWGDSTTLLLDTRTEPQISESIDITYDASWIGGNSGATVVISDNGVEVRRMTGAGEFTYRLSGVAQHDLVYTTIIGGVAQKDVYRASVFSDKYAIRFNANGGDGMMNEFLVPDMGTNLPECAFTKDGNFLFGWALTPDGEAMLLDGDTTTDILAQTGETVTLYAVWHEGSGTGVIGGEGLVAYYPFAGMREDVSGNGHEFTDVSGGMFCEDRFGNPDSAMSFNGSGQYASGADISLWTTFSVACWFQTSVSKTSQGSASSSFNAGNALLFPSHGENNAGVGLSVGTDGLAVTEHGSGYLPTKLNYSATIGSDWNHICMVVENNTSVSLYLNGKLVSSGSLSSRAKTFGLNLGGGGWGYYTGKVDDVRVYDKALSESEVLDVFNGPFTYAIRYDANGGKGTMAKRVYAMGENMMLPAMVFERDGWTFVGWGTEADGPVVFANEEAIEGGFDAANGETTTLYARWSRGAYSVHFDANGGNGLMDDGTYWLDINGELPECAFKKEGHFFLGWALTPEGEATLLDGDSTADIVAEAGETVTLYAVWQEGTAMVGDKCKTGGNASWYVQTSDTHDGIAAVRSGTISHNQSTWIETTVTGTGTISFWWKVSSEGGGDYLRFYVDGNQKDGISGGISWAQKSFDISGDGDHTIRWTYSKDGSGSSRSDCGWVGEVTWPTSDKLYCWVSDSRPPQLDGFHATYAIRFDANGGEGTMAKRVCALGDNVALPANAFSCDGLVFGGWATGADGPIAYADGEVVDGGIIVANGEAATLYARWSQGQYTVHFDANGGNGAMADELLWLDIPDSLPPNTFMRTGYTFKGWATTANGEVVHGDEAQVLDLSSVPNGKVTLYAVWSPHEWTIRFFNEGDFLGSQDFAYDSLEALDGNTATKTGYTFVGWATENDGEKAYDDGEEILNLTAEDGVVMDFHAVWTPNAYTVVFDANGGAGTMAPQQFNYDEEQALTANAFTRADRVFSGWATTANGTVEYPDCAVVSNLTAEADGEVRLYAVWAGSRIVFDANGGEGSMESFFVIGGTEQTLPQGTFMKDGHFLLGWALTPDGEAMLLDGDSTANIVAEAGETVTLYAIWHEGEVGGKGLSVKYYDIASISDSSWHAQVDTYEECVAYHAAMTPTMVTNSFDIGDTLDFGDNNNSTAYFHGRYAQKDTENFVMLLEGTMTFEESGNYSFQAKHDDGCVFYMDGSAVYSKYNAGGWNTFSADINKGRHDVIIAMHEGGGGQSLRFQMKRPFESSYSGLPQSILSHGASAYAVRFNANGGTGTMSKRVYAAGEDIALPANAFTRSGETFAGWGTEPQGPVAYVDGETFESGIAAANGQTITLYAQWGFSIGNGVWEYPDGDGPITLGAPVVAPSGAVNIPAEIDGRPIVAITADAFAWNTNITSVAIPNSVTNVAGMLHSSELLQAKFNSRYEITSTAGDADMADVAFVSGAIAAYTKCDDSHLSFSDPLSGQSFEWNRNNTTFAYFGQMWMDSGKTYVFGAHFDNDAYVKVDGQELVNIKNSSEYSIYSGRYECRESGWHDVEFRVSDEGGGKGSWGYYWNEDFGLGYRDDGRTGNNTQSGWKRLIDPGDGSLFRYGIPAFSGCTGISKVTLPRIYGDRLTDIFPNAAASMEEVVLLNGVEAIPDNFFAGCTKLASVTIPNSVTNIGGKAFADCYGLASISIPRSVVSIGNSAFTGCSGLASATIGSGVKAIGTEAFKGCSGLASLTIPNSVTNIGDKAFEGCGGLKSVSLGNGITSLNGFSFRGNTNLVSIAIGSGITEIEGNAFRDCVNLKTVKISNGVKRIGDEAFRGCSSLPAIDIPESVEIIGGNAFMDSANLATATLRTGLKEIGGGAFMGCQKLTSVSIPGTVERVKDNDAFANSGLTTIEIGNGVGAIGARAFRNCAKLQTVKVRGRIGSLGENAFEGCNNLTSVQISDLAAWAAISFNGAAANPLSYTHELVVNGREITNVVIPDGAEKVGSYAFFGCNRITSVTIPGSAVSVGNNAFEGCAALQSATILDGVKSLGWDVFTSCDNLISVEIPSSVTEIPTNWWEPDWREWISRSPFFDCNNIISICIPGLWNLSDIIPHPEKITDLTIPSGTTAIVDNAFNGCYNIRAVVIPDSVKSIGANAFEDCKGIVSMKIGKGVESIANGVVTGIYSYYAGIFQGYDTCAVFARNYTLTAFEVDPDNSHFKTINGVLYTKDGKELVAFPAGCGGEYAIPYGVEKIWTCAFCGASELNSLMIPDTVTEIGDGVFSGCENLWDVYLPARFKDNKQIFFAVKKLSSCSYCTFTYSRPVDRTLRLDGQGGVVATTTVNPSYCYAMPQISPPTRAGYAFGGYYSEPNGGGTQYYNADGTSARAWDSTTVTTLYAKWTLPATPLSVHRFYSKAYKGHFFTIDEEEKQNLIDTNPNWRYEGAAYRAYMNEAAGTTALYRFYSKSYKGHFFTTDDEERDVIIAGNPNWKYEGIAYYVYPDAASERVPVFRFYSKRYRHHFYTTDESEKENLVATNPNWKYEGIAFYALPADDTGRKANGVVRAAAAGVVAGAAGAGGEGVGEGVGEDEGERTGETGAAAAPWTLTLRHPCPGRVLAVPDVADLGDIVVEAGDEMSACLAILATGANVDVSAAADAAELRLALPDGIFTVQLWDGVGTLLDEQEAEGVFDFAIIADGAWHRLAIFDADGKEVFAIWLRAE